jgi:HD superfamily phosphohydrolase
MSLAPGKTLKQTIEENARNGDLFGDVRTVRVLSNLLGAVAHVHQRGLVHRDIKDANVMRHRRGANDDIYLIDFGFCKPEGDDITRSFDSFWRVGAPRFSPPSKLSNPAIALRSHDVFAVGVIGYRLLTGQYPWSVDHQDVGALREVQLTHRLVPAIESNSYIAQPISDLVSALLRLDDEARPSAEEALEEAERILADATASGGVLKRGKRTLIFPHIQRDPIYGDIRLTEYEHAALSTQEMQRLRGVRQLGLTNRVFAGAEHSRLSHSIGCVTRVEQALQAIEYQEGVKVDDELRLIARLYALTHDVTHIPFGHTIEDELSFFDRHDSNGPRIDRLVFSPASQLGHLLKQNETGRAVLKLFEPEFRARPDGVIYDLVSGVTGADVLDYVDRDAYFCGLDHRIDSAIFRQFRLQPVTKGRDSRLISMVGDEYGLRVDREYAVEHLLAERYALFLKIYTHRSKLAASALLAKGLSEAINPVTGGRPQFREEQFEKLGMTDDVILDRMVQMRPPRQGSRFPVVQWAAEQILQRKLPRAAYRAVPLYDRSERKDDIYRHLRTRLMEEHGLFDPRQRALLEQELAKRAKLQPHQVMVYCPAKAPGYQRAEHWVASTRDTSPIRTRPGFGSDVAARHLGLWELWVFLCGRAGFTHL